MHKRLLPINLALLILLSLSEVSSAQPFDEISSYEYINDEELIKDEISSYEYTNITFALIYNGTGLSPLEGFLESYLSSTADSVQTFPPSASTGSLLGYDIIIQAENHLSKAKIDEIEDSNGSLILIHQGIENINTSRWSNSTVMGAASFFNKTYTILSDTGATRGYPENSSFTIMTNTSMVRLDGSGNYTKHVASYDSKTVVASKRKDAGETVLIGFNLSSHHERRILDKAVYWITNKVPKVHQNSRYCLYECPWIGTPGCRPCADVVVVIDDPTNITPQENSSYYFVYTQHGDIVNKLEYSEFTIANLSRAKLVVLPKEDKITSKIPELRSQNKSLMFVYTGVLEAEKPYFGGAATELINKTNITNGDAQIVSVKTYEPTYGYPEGAHVYTQNEGQRVLASVPGYTTLANTTDGTLLSYTNGNGSSKVVFYGFDPYASRETQCDLGYHGSILYLRSVQWAIGTLNVTTDPPKTITLLAYNNDVNKRCANTLTLQESYTSNRLTSRYGAGNITTLDLSLANAANYSNTRLVISASSERVTSLLDDWASANKSIMLLHEGAVDVNVSILGGTSLADSLSAAAIIQENNNGSIAYGYPSNALILTQNYSDTSYRYLTDVPGFAKVAAYNSTYGLLLSGGSGNRIVVYGFDPYLASLDDAYCAGYHGWKLFDRSIDWLLYSLNITAPKAKRIAIQFYGANETWSCDTQQESRAYARLNSKNYSRGNVSKVDLSVANITDYSETELIIIGDNYRVSSLIPVWETDKKDIMFLLHGAPDAANHFGGTFSVDPTNSSYINISRSVVGEITMGYVGDVYVKAKAYLDTGLNPRRFVHNLTGFTTLATNSEGASVLSYQRRLGHNIVAYTSNLTPEDTCLGYHGWKLFDRSIEWLLGELSVPSLKVGRIGLVVNSRYNDSNLCLLPEENKTLERVLSLRNVSLGNINATIVDISEISVADFSDTEAMIITDSNVDAIGSYYESLLEGATYYGFNPTAVLMFQTGMDRYRRIYNKTSCNYTMHTGPLYGRITTTNDQNRLKELPPYGYPYNARVQVHGSDASSCFWTNPESLGFFGFLKNDTGATQWTGVASSVKYSEKFVLLGYRPYDAWTRGFDDSRNDYYHGSKIFDRSLLWLLGDEVRKNKTKDIVLIVYNKNNILPKESFTLNNSKNRFTDSRFSFLDISDVIYYDTCGASRFIAVTGDLASGIVAHWDNQTKGLVFLGESLYDASKGLEAFTEGKVDPLEDEYSSRAIYGQIINNSYTPIFTLPINSNWELTNDSTGVYSIQKIVHLSSNYTPLVLHSNRTLGDDEVLLAVSNTSIKHGIVLFGVNTANLKDVGWGWILNSIEWSHEKDLTPPNVTNVLITPSLYTPGDRIVLDVDAVDNRNWSVYAVMINYTKNNVNWTTANLTRIVDPDSYTCDSKPNMNHWNGSIGPFNETFIVYTILAVDTSGNVNSTNLRYYGVSDTTPPSIHNIGFSPYMPNASDNVTIHWNTDEFSNATLYFRANGSGDSWTEVRDSEFRVFNHTVNTGNHTANTTYQYWIKSCDLSGNCGNATNGGEYYWFCVEPGCEKDQPNITSYLPPNGTIFPANTTEITLTINTSEWAECRYSNTSDQPFNSMTYDFNRTYNRTHTAYLAIETEKYYYLRCKDMLGNKNNKSLILYYWVDSQPPTITLNYPANYSTHAGSLVTFKYTPEDNGIVSRCSLHTNFDNWYLDSPIGYNITKGSEHNLTSRLCDGTFVWNVQCWDSVNNTAFASANFTFTINSTQPMLVIANGEGSANGQLDWPEGLDVFGNTIYIADKENHRIQKYHKYSGENLGRLGGPNPVLEGGLFTLPEAVSAYYTTTSNGSHYFNITEIYVADTQEMRIQIYYELNSSIRGNITGLDDPRGVTARKGKIYVSDTDNNKVKVYNTTNLSLDFSISNLNRPEGLEVDNDKIYVANTGNHNLLVYSIYGNLLYSLGTPGTGTGQFQSPEDVAVDSAGNIYVADTLNHRIQVFNSTPGYIKTLGSYGVSETQFNQPAGVAMDEDDKLYVSDTRNSRVQVFSLCFVTTTTTTTSTSSTSSTSTTSTTTTSTTSTTTTIVRAEVVLNEIYAHPNPETPNDWDWVELYNRGNINVNLTNWVLDDAEGGSPNYTITSGIIPVRGFILLNSSVTGINFDSTGDDARLFNNTGELVDNHTWSEDPDVSVSWMRSPDGYGPWIKSDSDHPPTPGQTNTVTYTQTYVTGWNLISLPLTV